MYCPSKTTSTSDLLFRRKGVHFKTDTNHDSAEIVEALSAALRRKRSKQGDDKKREIDIEKTKYVHFLKIAIRYSDTDFEGICEDIGASVNFSGLKQYKAYCSHSNSLFHLAPSDHILKFGGKRYNFLGMATVRAPLNDFAFIEFECDVVGVDVPMLLGLLELNHIGVCINNITSKMVHHYLGWEVPVTYKHGHLFYCWDPDHNVLFTRAGLHKLHMQFYHPSVKKLFKILRPGRPEDIDEDTRKILSDIEQSCKTCMEVKRRPYRFYFAIPDDDIVFNRELIIDVFFPDGKPVLSMVDKDTNFIPSVFVKNESAKEIWSQFVLLWVNALAQKSYETIKRQYSALNSSPPGHKAMELK